MDSFYSDCTGADKIARSTDPNFQFLCASESFFFLLHHIEKELRKNEQRGYFYGYTRHPSTTVEEDK